MEVTQYLCGFVVAPAVLMPGETTRLTLTVDEDVCEGGGVISMASMLGDLTYLSVTQHAARRGCSI